MTNEEDLYKNFNKDKGDFGLLAPKYEKTLRDEFAMAALDRCFTYCNENFKSSPISTLEIVKKTASLSYWLADAMLEARKAKEE